jgi:hypothetical protein
MHFLQAINSDLSVLIVCNKTGGTIKGDIKNIYISHLLQHSHGLGDQWSVLSVLLRSSLFFMTKACCARQSRG